ncbi:MAG: SUMF1/EgtB/PvdO family nonheme iron enzyme [Planctomycetota bacterium]|nr:SUMF1/EgtB/PvdO family nonheme iron enzyme [Planctomycetota bacterium]
MKKTSVLAVVVCVMAVANFASADTDTFGTGDNEFSIDFVPISGDTGNLGSWSAGEGYTFSGVNHGNYRMGTYEISNAQWTKFKAAYGAVTGSPSSAYDYYSYYTGTNIPTNCTSWYEAAQFVNYLNTSTYHPAAYKFTGTQGTSDYTLGVWQSGDVGYSASNPYRNSNAYYFLPTENEWVKAAYWNGTGLQTYANASAGDLVGGGHSPDPARWNYYPSVGYEPWNVTSGSQELNGTYNMMGNVWEWNETLIGEHRGLRGGTYGSYDNSLASSYRNHYDPDGEDYYGFGFRVASVPEPATLLLVGLGGLFLRRRN